MGTTLDIDDDLLAAAREMARRERRSLGKVISTLARRSLTGTGAERVATATTGFRPFPSRGVPVTNEMIDRLRDAEGA